MAETVVQRELLALGVALSTIEVKGILRVLHWFQQ